MGRERLAQHHRRLLRHHARSHPRDRRIGEPFKPRIVPEVEPKLRLSGSSRSTSATTRSS
jgi:hypothetical protein